ncbi:MAG: hypothetical protein HY541_00365 [Deltaproteobacteria bacterium]|nr:hypothetical protein [Deltaproteobacteria bacterium]
MSISFDRQSIESRITAFLTERWPQIANNRSSEAMQVWHADHPDFDWTLGQIRDFVSVDWADLSWINQGELPKLLALAAKAFDGIAPDFSTFLTDQHQALQAIIQTEEGDRLRALQNQPAVKIHGETADSGAEITVQPLPDDVIARLAAQVGDMPAREVDGDIGEKEEKRKSPLQFSEEAVRRLLDSVVVYRVDNTLYYFPIDLEKIRYFVCLYLKNVRQEGSRRTMADSFDTLWERWKNEALIRWTQLAPKIDSLDDIIPEGFVRADELALTDVLTGNVLNPAEVTARIRRNAARNKSGPDWADAVRVAVVGNHGRRIYYVRPDLLEGRYADDLFKIPTVAEFMDILSPSHRQEFIPFLNKLRRYHGQPPINWEEPPVFHLIGHSDSGSLFGFRVLTADEMNFEPDDSYFQLTFDPRFFISRLRGNQALKMGQHFIGFPAMGLIERAFLSTRWGSRLHTEGGEGISWNDFVGFFARQAGGEPTGGLSADPIDILWEQQRLADPQLPDNPRKLVLSAGRVSSQGSQNKSGVYSLQLAQTGGKSPTDIHYLRVFFRRTAGGWFVRKIRGQGSMEFALRYLKAKQGIELADPVQRALLMSLWEANGSGWNGLQNVSDISWPGKLTFADFQQRLRNPQSLKDWWNFQRQVSPWLAEHAPTFVLSGTSRGNSKDLSQVFVEKLILRADGTRPESNFYFGLQFEESGGKLYLRKANGLNALRLAFAAVGGMVGRDIQHPLEKAVLASCWGRPPASKHDSSLRLTWGELKNYFVSGMADPIGELWNLKRRTDPSLMAHPARLVLVGQRKGTGDFAPVIAVRLVTCDQVESLRDRCFAVVFEWDGTRYVAENYQGRQDRGALELFDFLRRPPTPAEKPSLALSRGSAATRHSLTSPPGDKGSVPIMVKSDAKDKGPKNSVEGNVFYGLPDHLEGANGPMWGVTEFVDGNTVREVPVDLAPFDSSAFGELAQDREGTVEDDETADTEPEMVEGDEVEGAGSGLFSPAIGSPVTGLPRNVLFYPGVSPATVARSLSIVR